MIVSPAEFATLFVLAVLATWRVSHLLALEDGPGNIIVKVRGRLGDGVLGGLMDCFYCVSLWIAAPAALLLTHAPILWLASWLAISGGACLLQEATEHSDPEQKQREGGDDVLR